MFTRPVTWKRTPYWQARIWIGVENGGDVSLGLHFSMQSANQFAQAVRSRLDRTTIDETIPFALTVWKAARREAKKQELRMLMLPKWVHRCRIDGEDYYIGRYRRNRWRIVTLPYRKPQLAFLSLWRKIKTMLKPSERTFQPNLFQMN